MVVLTLSLPLKTIVPYANILDLDVRRLTQNTGTTFSQKRATLKHF